MTHFCGAQAISIRYRQQELDRDAAGRMTVSDLILWLASKTGWEISRWEEVVVEALRKKELPLKNPRNDTDRLPYAVPDEIKTWYEQVSVEDVDAWLDAHAEWAVSHRLRLKPDDRDAEVAALSETAADEPWIIEAKRLADKFALKMWTSGIRQITARGVAPKVAVELEKNRDHWGKQGPRDANTIRTYALKGWKFTPPSGSDGSNGS